MPLTTTEVPTFFGPPDSRLFGVVPRPILVRVPCDGCALAELPERIEGHSRHVCVRIGEVDTADADRVFGHAHLLSGDIRAHVSRG